MPLFLKERKEHLTEKMDQPDCDKVLLFNTYQQFSTINRLISGWQRIYKNHIRPVFQDPSKPYSLLDIGCGGGDIINLIDRLAKKDGINLQIKGIEPDERAVEFLSNQNWAENISFIKASSNDLVKDDYSFDIVISNHMMHHLKKPELKMICEDAEKLATQKIVFSDIERSDIGYVAFKVGATPLFRNSFIVEDGLTSIKRSFRKDELQNILPKRWRVKRQFPFRLLAICEAS